MRYEADRSDANATQFAFAFVSCGKSLARDWSRYDTGRDCAAASLTLSERWVVPIRPATWIAVLAAIPRILAAYSYAFALVISGG